jgi:RimJ/RimL family protein N-acetyltransferase
VLIETDRLLLRRIRRDDLDELVAIHAAPEVARFWGLFDRPKVIELMHLNQREWRERGHGRLAIVERATGRFSGGQG